MLYTLAPMSYCSWIKICSLYNPKDFYCTSICNLLYCFRILFLRANLELPGNALVVFDRPGIKDWRFWSTSTWGPKSLEVGEVLQCKTKKCCLCRLLRLSFASSADRYGHVTKLSLKELSCSDIIAYFCVVFVVLWKYLINHKILLRNVSSCSF